MFPSAGEGKNLFSHFYKKDIAKKKRMGKFLVPSTK